eukprot:3307228-Alexandrium_andersonii.AAC.1
MRWPPIRPVQAWSRQALSCRQACAQCPTAIQDSMMGADARTPPLLAPRAATVQELQYGVRRARGAHWGGPGAAAPQEETGPCAGGGPVCTVV